MKTSVINFNRLGLLFKKYFIERFNTELIYWSIMAIVFMLIRNLTPLMVGLILIAGIFYTARFFREIHLPGTGIAYFMIPATQVEKLILGIVMTSIYFLFMMTIVYTIGNLLGTFVNNTLANLNFLHLGGMSLFTPSSVQWKLLEETIDFSSWSMFESKISFLGLVFRIYLVIQSTFLLGSIYFKNNQAFKTLLAIVFIHFVLFIILFFEIRIIMNAYSINVQQMDHNIETWLGILKTTVYTFFNLLPAFLYVVSFFRLTEKQI